MVGITTDSLKIRLAEDFIDTMTSSNNSLYMFIGKETTWPNEPAPDQPNESVASYKDIWNDMIAMKKITENNMQLVIPRNQWTSNTIYTSYSDRNTSLFDTTTKFYVINSNNEIYKCLSNNYSIPSTIEPSGIGLTGNNYVLSTNDGYQWKYMLNIEPGDIFLNHFWVPIPRISPTNSSQELIEEAAVPGSIDVINVVSNGVGYANGDISYIVNITGDGVGANAYASVVAGRIQDITVVNRGQDYTYADITFIGSGSGANAVAILPPEGGHGSNAVRELGASYAMISITTSYDEGGYFTTSNSFRRNGLIVNPVSFNDPNVTVSNNLIKTTTTLNMSGGIGNYIPSEIVFQGLSIETSTFSGTIVDFDSVSGTLRLNNIKGRPLLQTILYGQNSGAQRYPTNMVDPDVKAYTGDIIYIDNEPPITRDISRLESFQYVIRF
jgi:hypothetical protein